MHSASKIRRRPHTHQNRLARALKRIGLGLLLVLVSVTVLDVFYTRAGAPTRVYAAAPSTLNFQARLQGANGGIVADGSYSIEFKLYTASSGGSAVWTETQSVTAKAGYLSVYLGSVAPFTGVDWSQQHWMTMNVNGDGEMNPRLRLTSVPSAFYADKAASLINGSGTLTANDLAQLAPSSIQAVNSALAALRINQTGSGALAQFQNNGVDAFTLASNGDLVSSGSASFGGGLKVGNSASTTAGTIRWNGTDFEGYDGTEWRSFTQGSGSSSNAAASFTSGLANVGANVTGTPVETLLFTTATAVSNVAGVTGFTAPADGSFRTCLIKNTANVTAGTLNLRWRVNGVSVGAGACTMNTTNNRQSATVIDPGVVTFSAGDTIGIAFDTVGMAPTTNDFTVFWTVEYGSNAVGGGGGASTLQDAYDLSTAPAVIATADNKDLQVSLTNTATDSNFLVNILSGSTGRFAVQDAGTDALSVTSTAITLAKPVTASAGLNLSNSGITNTGSITGVGTNITASAGLTIASSGAGDLTLNSASGLVVVGAGTVRTADSLNLDLNKATDTALTLTNGGTGISNLNLGDGALQTGGTTRLTNGGVLQNITGLTVTSGGASITGNIVLGGSSSDRLTITSQILGSNALVFQGATDNSFATTLAIADPTGSNTITLPNASGTLVLDSRSILAGTGLTGGGNLGADRTLSLDINGLSATTAVNQTDYLAVYDGSGIKKIARSDFLQGVIGALQYRGTWDASTNTPSLSDVTGTSGHMYAVSVGGTQNLGSGNITFGSGDFIIHNGTVWQKAPSSTGVASVFGRTGAVVAQGGDYTASQITNVATGNIAAVTVQAAINELDNEKLGSLNGLTGTSQTFVNDTNVTVTSSGSTHTFGWSGQLSVARGGTGASSFTTNGILYGNNTGALQVTGAGTGGQLLVANASGVPGFVSLAGDATLSDTGVLTIAADAVALGSNTTGDYIQNLGTLTGLSTTGNSGEGSTPSLSVIYGSSANTAVQGNTTITVSPGTNLTGGGTLTLGAGGTVTLNTSANPTFTGSVTSPVFTSNSGLTLSSTGSGNDITLTTADKIILSGFDCSTSDNGGVLTVNAAGELICDNDDGGSGGSVSGSGTAGRLTFYSGANSLGDSWLLQDVSTLRLDTGRNLDLVNGNLSIGGTTVLTSGLALQNLTGLNVASNGADITGDSTITGTLTGLTGLTVASGGASISGGLNLNSSALSGVTTISISGAITGATSGNTINGLIINSGALSGVTTISASGAITAATSGNTINGLIINSGALSGITTINTSGGLTIGGNSSISGTLTGLTGLTVASGGASITGNTSLIGGNLLVQQTGTGAAVMIDRTDGVIGSLKSGSAKVAFFFDEVGSFAISKDSRANISAGTGAGVDLLNITSAGAVTLAGSLSGVTTLTTTGAITAPTTTNTINGLIINAGALSGVTTLNLTGAITGATATNTINGLVINSGALSGITGYTQTSGNFGISGTGTFGTGTGLTSINGAMTTTGLATFNGNITLQTGDTLTVNGDAFTDLTGNGLQITTGALNILAQTGGGLSTSASGLTLLRTCSNGQLLKWNGTAWACAADNTGISDVRFKENITEVSSVLDQIKNIRVVNYNFKCNDPAYSDKAFVCDSQTGVIAQELAAIFPGLVKLNEEGYNEVDFGALNFYTLKATTELAKIVGSNGDITASNISTGGVLRLGANGVLQNLNGLSVSAGGASIAGGLNNNFGSIANVGSLSGVSFINAESINLNSGAANALTLTKNGQGVFTLFASGALEMKLDDAHAFAIKDAAGNGILNVDSASGRISLGSVGKTILLTFGVKDTAGDPAGINGSEYYNSATGKFRCYQNNKWQDCLPVTNASYTIGDRVQNWAQPSNDQEIPGEYRTWIDLTNAREFRLIMRVSGAGSQDAVCRMQYANGDNGPWTNLGDLNAKLKVDQTGTLKADWAKIDDNANTEVLVRVVCSGNANNNPVPDLSFSNLSVQLR